MIEKKTIDLGRKLLALAERGEAGEKANAKRVLDKFMEKHGIAVENLRVQPRSRRIVTGVDSSVKQMFINLVASIAGANFHVAKCSGRGYWAVELNDREWLEFQEKWPVYRKALKAALRKKRREMYKQFDLTIKAFISKHDLYSSRVDGSEEEEEAFPTPEEMEEILEMLRIREEMENINFYKKLNA